MRRSLRQVVLTLVSLVLFGAGGLAHAQPHPGKGYGNKSDRPVPMVPAKHDEVERVRDGHGSGRPFHDRLSPEERRQLRRDIDQHGRELYRGRNR